MSYLSTIAWVHKTFTTRQRTAELLRPELDEHVLSQHDYELATRFLPGPSMDWHVSVPGPPNVTSAVHSHIDNTSPHS